MKHLDQYINEQKELTPSKDLVKNDIYNYLKGFKIVWKVNTVDDALADITKEKYLERYLNSSDLKGAEKIYWMKCWNGGSTLTKSSPYNQAEIVSYKNNTDTKWFFVVNGKSVTVIRYTTRYYGMGEIKEVINKFEI